MKYLKFHFSGVFKQANTWIVKKLKSYMQNLKTQQRKTLVTLILRAHMNFHNSSIKTMHSVAIDLCCPPELDSKTLLLKTSHYLTRGFQDFTGLEASSMVAIFHSNRR